MCVLSITGPFGEPENYWQQDSLLFRYFPPFMAEAKWIANGKRMVQSIGMRLFVGRWWWVRRSDESGMKRGLEHRIGKEAAARTLTWRRTWSWTRTWAMTTSMSTHTRAKGSLVAQLATFYSPLCLILFRLRTQKAYFVPISERAEEESGRIIINVFSWLWQRVGREWHFASTKWKWISCFSEKTLRYFCAAPFGG